MPAQCKRPAQAAPEAAFVHSPRQKLRKAAEEQHGVNQQGGLATSTELLPRVDKPAGEPPGANASAASPTAKTASAASGRSAEGSVYRIRLAMQSTLGASGKPAVETGTEGSKHELKLHANVYEGTDLQDYIDAALRKLSPEQVERIRSLPKETATLGTACSGAGTAEMVHDAVLSRLGVEGGLRLYSCECTGFKQKHLINSIHPLVGNPDAHVFSDIGELHTGVAHCARHERKCLVSDKAFLSVIGYSCKNMSKYCCKELGHVLEHRIGSSSETCEAMLAFVNKFRTPIVIMENVEEMAKPECMSSNVAYLNKRYRAMGYEIDSALLWADMYYLPQARKRAWTIAVNREAFGFSEQTARHWLRDVFETVRQLQVPPKGLSKMFLPTSHELVQAERQRLQERRVFHGNLSDRAGKSWQQKHAKFRKVHGVPESARLSVPPQTATSKWFKSMSLREREVLAVSVNIFKRALIAVNVGQSIDRATKWREPTCLPTITPGAKLYLTARRDGKAMNRLLLGYEGLLFQGLPANLWTETTELSNKQMMDLAGNAFPSTQCAAVMIAIFANLPAIRPGKLFTGSPSEGEGEARAEGEAAEARPQELVPPVGGLGPCAGN